MIHHLVIIGSDYISGKRIALHFEGNTQEEVLDKFIEINVKDLDFDEMSLSIHQLATDKKGWDEVKKYDPFFKDISEIKDISQFTRKIKKSETVKAEDIAQLILTVVDATQLKLQKLLYLCYADYLKETKQRMFEEKIYAYKYGPVVKSVLRKYKNFGSEEIEDIDDTLNIEIENKEFKIPISVAKIFAAPGGVDIVSSCMVTIGKYGSKSARQLVELTHQKDWPWSKVYSDKKRNIEITDEIILKHH